jgi:hypothetical protein
MDRQIRLETTSSYDENKYESLGVVNAAMSVTVSFTAPTPVRTSFFASAPKPVPVDKQQKLTSTENQMIQALKKQLTMNAPPGTERLIDFKISPPDNIAHSPEYILSMLASATAIRKVSPDMQQGQSSTLNSVNAPPSQAQPPPLPQPLAQPLAQPMSQPLGQMSQPLGQMSQPMSQPLSNVFQRQQGGKKRKAHAKRTIKKKRHTKRTRKHHK